MHPLPLQSWTWVLVILYVLPMQEIFTAAELDHGMAVQRNQRDTSGRYNPHAGQHQHIHHDGKEHHHEGEEHRHDGEEHHHVEEAQEQNTVENFAPPEKGGYQYAGAPEEKGVIEAPDTKFDYDDKTVAPVCGCVLKNQCGGVKEDEDTVNILRATPTTLVCGLKYQMCCKYDYYENGQPWPGVVDLYLDKAPCVAEEICRRPYGVQPTDVRDFGTIPHCPGFGSVRCLDGFAVKDDASLFIPNEQPTHIEVPIFPTVETNDLSGVVQTFDTPVSIVPEPVPEPEIPKTSYGVPVIPYTYLPPTPPPVTPPPATPPPVTTPPETPPPVTTPPVTPPPVTTPPETPPPVTGYTYPTTVPPTLPPVTEPPYVYHPPPPVTEPPYVYHPPPPVTEPPQVYLPPPPVTEPPQVYLPPVTEPPQGYLPPVAVPPSSYRAPAVDIDRELLIEEKPVVPVVTSSRYYSPPLRGFYKSRPKYFTIPKIGYYGAPYYKNFYNYNPYYKGFNFGGFNFQKRISFSKSIYG